MKDMATGDVMEAQAPRINGRHASMGAHASMDASPVQAAHDFIKLQNQQFRNLMFFTGATKRKEKSSSHHAYSSC